MSRRALLFAFALAACSALVRAEKFDTKTVSFAVAVHDVTAAYRDFSMFALPDARVAIDAVGGPPGDYALDAKDGIVEPLSVRKWRWTAPMRPGTYALKLHGPGGKDTVTLHAFVLVPFKQVKHGWLNGYRIGEYPPPLKDHSGNPLYLPPPGFVEVTRDNEHTKVSPHFELMQFVCREDTTPKYPKYVVVRERLLLDLEAVLERVNALGFTADTLHVMSAYRTPYYNHAIGDVRYSMHQFGGAADIFIDPGNKGRMIDLNGDGVVDLGDSKFLYDEIDRMLETPPYQRFQGGLGFYRGTSAHPPFVHLDVRGTRARWQG